MKMGRKFISAAIFATVPFCQHAGKVIEIGLCFEAFSQSSRNNSKLLVVYNLPVSVVEWTYQKQEMT